MGVVIAGFCCFGALSGLSAAIFSPLCAVLPLCVVFRLASAALLHLMSEPRTNQDMADKDHRHPLLGLRSRPLHLLLLTASMSCLLALLLSIALTDPTSSHDSTEEKDSSLPVSSLLSDWLLLLISPSRGMLLLAPAWCVGIFSHLMYSKLSLSSLLSPPSVVAVVIGVLFGRHLNASAEPAAFGPSALLPLLPAFAEMMPLLGHFLFSFSVLSPFSRRPQKDTVRTSSASKPKSLRVRATIRAVVIAACLVAAFLQGLAMRAHTPRTFSIYTRTALVCPLGERTTQLSPPVLRALQASMRIESRAGLATVWTLPVGNGGETRELASSTSPPLPRLEVMRIESGSADEEWGRLMQLIPSEPSILLSHFLLSSRLRRWELSHVLAFVLLTVRDLWVDYREEVDAFRNSTGEWIREQRQLISLLIQKEEEELDMVSRRRRKDPNQLEVISSKRVDLVTCNSAFSVFILWLCVRSTRVICFLSETNWKLKRIRQAHLSMCNRCPFPRAKNNTANISCTLTLPAPWCLRLLPSKLAPLRRVRLYPFEETQPWLTCKWIQIFWWEVEGRRSHPFLRLHHLHILHLFLYLLFHLLLLLLLHLHFLLLLRPLSPQLRLLLQRICLFRSRTKSFKQPKLLLRGSRQIRVTRSWRNQSQPRRNKAFFRFHKARLYPFRLWGCIAIPHQSRSQSKSCHLPRRTTTWMMPSFYRRWKWVCLPLHIL